MTLAISLAMKAGRQTLPNPRVGAIVFDDKFNVLGMGYHKKYGKEHAEVLAIRDALKKGYKTKNTNLCVTLEPCNHFGKTPPCTKAIIEAGIKNVFIGVKDDCNTVCGCGLEELKKHGIQVTSGILEKECMELNPGFHKFNKYGLPFLRIKIATSLNGIMGSTWFTSEKARTRVHELRLASDLIITGLGTIKKDDPKFTSRIGKKVFKNTVAIMDENLSLYSKYIKKNLNIFSAGNRVILITGNSKKLDKKINALQKKNITVISHSINKQKLINIKTLIPRLAKEYGFRELMLEAGPKLTGSFIKDAKKQVDKINIFIAPTVLKGTKQLPNLSRLLIEKEEVLENTLALEARFDI